MCLQRLPYALCAPFSGYPMPCVLPSVATLCPVCSLQWLPYALCACSLQWLPYALCAPFSSYPMPCVLPSVATLCLQWLPYAFSGYPMPCVLLFLSMLLLLACSCGNPEVGGPSITQARHRTHLSKCADSLNQFLGMWPGLVGRAQCGYTPVCYPVCSMCRRREKC